jgi:hypothetical protein
MADADGRRMRRADSQCPQMASTSGAINASVPRTTFRAQNGRKFRVDELPLELGETDDAL